MRALMASSGTSWDIASGPNHSDHGGRTPSRATLVNISNRSGGINAVFWSSDGKPASTKTMVGATAPELSTMFGSSGPAPLCATKTAPLVSRTWFATSATTADQPLARVSLEIVGMIASSPLARSTLPTQPHVDGPTSGLWTRMNWRTTEVYDGGPHRYPRSSSGCSRDESPPKLRVPERRVWGNRTAGQRNLP